MPFSTENADLLFNTLDEVLNEVLSKPGALSDT